MTNPNSPASLELVNARNQIAQSNTFLAPKKKTHLIGDPTYTVTPIEIPRGSGGRYISSAELVKTAAKYKVSPLEMLKLLETMEGKW
jgi:hypothetical protein